jgi:hypothetical protein
MSRRRRPCFGARITRACDPAPRRAATNATNRGDRTGPHRRGLARKRRARARRPCCREARGRGRRHGCPRSTPAYRSFVTNNTRRSG